MATNHEIPAAGCSRRTFVARSAAALALTTGASVGLGPAAIAATTGDATSAASTVASSPATKSPPQLKLGMASFTLRKFSLDQAIAMTKRLGLTNLALKSFHLPLDSSPETIAAAAKKVRDAGLTLYGCSAVTLRKPAEVDQVFAYAKAAGMETIVAMPMAQFLPQVEELVKRYDIRVAIHNHGPEDKNFPSPGDVYRAVEKLDRRIGLCIDVGHTFRIGEDPAAAVRQYADRLYDVHLKDVTAASKKGVTCVLGRGVMDIPALLRALIDINYSNVAAFEYEEEAEDPLPSVAQSVGYARGFLAANS